MNNNTSPTKKLAVYLNKIFTGIFEQNLSGGSLSFTYDPDYLKSKNAAQLSISLPLRSEPFGNNIVKAFFSGLLPEDEQLKLLAEKLKLSERSPFALLFEVGRDCAGAIEILPPKEKLPTYLEGSTQALNATQLYEVLKKDHSSSLFVGNKKTRLSLAGAQRKFAVFFDEAPNSLPELVLEKPSTHILKPLMPNHADSVHNEFFCMKLAKEIGLDVAEVFFKQIKDRPYLLVRRYDRTKNNKGIITRVHQEDFCQALGLRPEQKYQGIDGGPGITTCKELITKHSSRPVFDQFRLLRAIIFNYLIGNSDAHGKNFSFLYEADGIRLAPFYDLISTTLYEQYDGNMAMKIGKSLNPERTVLAHWHDIVADTNTARTHLHKELKTFATKLPKAAENLKQQLIKQRIESEVFDVIIKLINKRAARILGYFKD